MKKYTCKLCKKVFESDKCRKRKYCSRECLHKGMFTGKVITCEQCGKKQYRRNWHIKQSKHFFCNLKCYFLYKKINSHGRINPTHKLKLKILEAYDYTCAFCRINKHELMKPLQFHHLDGGVRNTVFENLIPLCVSCHRKTQKKKKL